MSKIRVFDDDGIELDYDSIKGLDVNCFGCWSKLKKKGGILFSPPSETSSDNVDQVSKFHLCQKCFNVTIEFIMGKESPQYKKGYPTLEEHPITKETNCEDKS